jgi:uncharacterized membrane-anchored protein
VRIFRCSLVFALALGASLIFARHTFAQSDIGEQIRALEWQEGPTTAELGQMATIEVPEGFQFIGKNGASKFMELLQNPSDGDELGVLLNVEDGWFVVFDFADMGYVKDDDKDALDAKAILASIRQGTEASNKVRKERGWPTLSVVGWHEEPFYDSETNNLTWSIRGASDDGESINHSTRLLGRRGVMRVNLVTSSEEIDAALPVFNEMLGEFSFTDGNKYSEFTRGDKIAEYGLAGLIVGGAGVALVKTGLLQKFGKLIVVGVVALLGLAKKLFAGLTGGRQTADSANV